MKKGQKEMQKSNSLGKKFERYIFELYKGQGHHLVKHDVLYRRKKARRSYRVQIDIEYGFPFAKRYIECKYRDEPNLPSSTVKLEEVAKFAGVLELIGASPGRGIMITNSRFDDRSHVYAGNKSLKLIEREDIAKKDYKSLPFLLRLKTNKKKYECDLEKRIRKMKI